MKILRWEQADPHWVPPGSPPTYIGEFLWNIDINWTWIANGATMTVPLPLPRPLVTSDGKSKVVPSDVELLFPQQVVLKVRLSDDMEHILDKGTWAATLLCTRDGRCSSG